MIFFAALAFIMTLLGGLFPLAKDTISRKGMWRLFSLRAGLLLAVAFTEILPEALKQNPVWAGWGALAAFVLLFVMSNFSMVDTCSEYLEQCQRHTIGWVALLALTVHSFIDGFNLSVSYSAGAAAGTAVGVALALHKIADGFTLTSLLKQSGYAKTASLAALVLVAAATPLGSFLSSMGLRGFSPAASAGWLGFAAGSFIYISAMDILPRLHHNEDKACLGYFGLGLFGLAALRVL